MDALHRSGPGRFSDGIPAAPPAFVLAEVRAAHVRMGALARAGVEVCFTRERATGRLAIDLRSAHGHRRLRPVEVFDLLDA